MAGASTLKALTLLEAARGFEFLAGDIAAGAFYRAGLVKADLEYATVQSGDPSAAPLLRELDQTKALWRLQDYPALELRFRVGRRLNPPLSIEARRAGCLLADALYYQNRFDEAANVILAVQSENLRVGDLGGQDNSDVYEMEYLQGYLLYCAGRAEAAIPHLRRVVGSGEHDEVASRALFQALLRAGRLDEGQRWGERLISRFNLPPAARAVVAQQIESARQSVQWRQHVLAESQ